MRDDFEIRRATERDLDAVHRIEAESFPVPWRREFFETELSATGRYALVATRHGQVIGYVFAMWLFDEMHINKIAVTARERRRGIADTLMDHCFEFARKSGVKTISLEVRESNETAQTFYKRRGFAAGYLRPRYYPDGEAAVVMSSDVA
jgi:ribosomal-protein-alanine N-acetyltransferase